MKRYRYGAFHGGPDPLAEPVDAAGAVDALADRILDGSSVRDALRDLLQRGADGMRGLDDLRRRIQQRRRELQKSGRLDGLLEKVREKLDEALDSEKSALFPDPSDDARFRESMLDMLPDDTSRAVRELADYDWRSPEARAAYDEIREMLRRDVLDQQFKNMSQAMHNPMSPESQQALKDMLSDLNSMLDKHRRGEDVSEDFEQFMDKHGEFFPDRPESFEQLLDDDRRGCRADEGPGGEIVHIVVVGFTDRELRITTVALADASDAAAFFLEGTATRQADEDPEHRNFQGVHSHQDRC